MSIVVHQVICEFEFVEGDDLFGPLWAFGGWVRMYMYTTRHVGIRFTCHNPTGTMERVSANKRLTLEKKAHKNPPNELIYISIWSVNSGYNAACSMWR